MTKGKGTLLRLLALLEDGKWAGTRGVDGNNNVDQGGEKEFAAHSGHSSKAQLSLPSPGGSSIGAFMHGARKT